LFDARNGYNGVIEATGRFKDFLENKEIKLGFDQLRAAGGTPVVWIGSSGNFVNTANLLFENNVIGIHAMHFP
jgi:hypothetical protein